MKRRASIRSARFFLGKRRVRPEARMQLVEELPGPIEEGAELIRIDHEINNERYWGQHEDDVSHAGLPCAGMLILQVSFRNQPVMKVNITGRKFRCGHA